jgi:hypothetical protein
MLSHAGLQARGVAAAVSVLLLHSLAVGPLGHGGVYRTAFCLRLDRHMDYMRLHGFQELSLLFGVATMPGQGGLDRQVGSRTVCGWYPLLRCHVQCLVG